MDICICTKQYFKESKDTQRAILSAVTELYRRIRLYESQNITFAKIFNDDQVKYDQHGEFFTFKCQKNHLQLRILYAYLMIDGVPTILVVDYFIKKKNNKDYIRRFDAHNELAALRAYQNSYYKESVQLAKAS